MWLVDWGGDAVWCVEVILNTNRPDKIKTNVLKISMISYYYNTLVFKILVKRVLHILDDDLY